MHFKLCHNLVFRLLLQNTKLPLAMFVQNAFIYILYINEWKEAMWIRLKKQ
jgi:hypothetical protein